VNLSSVHAATKLFLSKPYKSTVVFADEFTVTVTLILKINKTLASRVTNKMPSREVRSLSLVCSQCDQNNHIHLVGNIKFKRKEEKFFNRFYDDEEEC
jgi:hypothetical protein